MTWYVSCDVSSRIAPTPPPVSSRGSGDSVRNISRGYFGHTRTSAVAPPPISRCHPPPPLTSRPPSRRRRLKVSGASPSSTVRDRGHGPSPSPSLSSAVQHVASSPSSNNNQPLTCSFRPETDIISLLILLLFFFLLLGRPLPYTRGDHHRNCRSDRRGDRSDRLRRRSRR